MYMYFYVVRTRVNRLISEGANGLIFVCNLCSVLWAFAKLFLSLILDFTDFAIRLAVLRGSGRHDGAVSVLQFDYYPRMSDVLVLDLTASTAP